MSVWKCDFEIDGRPSLCGMKNDDTAEFDWTVTNLKTPSRHTGPDVAYRGSYYAYIEASKPRKEGDRAREGRGQSSPFFHQKM